MLEGKLYKKMYTAIENGDINTIKSLMQNDDLKTVHLDWDKNTPLHIAAYYNQTAVVKVLLEAGLSPEDIQKPNEYGQTALAYAAENKNKDLIAMLLDAMTLSIDKTRALFETCLQNKYNDVGKVLLSRLSIDDLQEQDEQGITLLMRASQYGNSPVAKAIIARVSTDHCVLADKRGLTSLMYAARSGSAAVVKQLLAILTPDLIAAKDASGKTAAIHSLCAGQGKTFELLQDTTDVNSPEKVRELLFKVIQASNKELVSFCNNAAALCQDGYEDFLTARRLFSKEEKGRIALMQSLLEKAFPDREWQAESLEELSKKAGLSRDDMQITESDDAVKGALFAALMIRDSSLFATLLSRLKPHHFTLLDDEKTSLLSAAIKLLNDVDDESRARKIVNIVLESIAAHSPEILSLPDKWGATPLHYAAWWRHYDIAKFLVERLTPEQICLQDDNGTTPLHASVSYYNANYLYDVDLRIPKMILHAGLTFDQLATKDKNGWSAFMWALIYGEQGIEQLIELFFKAGFTWDDVSMAAWDDGTTVFNSLVRDGKIAWTEQLLQRFSSDDLSVQNKSGETALMLAAKWASKEMVVLLLSYLSREQIVMKDRWEKTALDHTYDDEIKELIQKRLGELEG